MQGSDCSFFLLIQAVQVHKSFLPITNQNFPVSVSVSLQKLISPDHNKISLPTRISLYLYLYLFKNRFHPIKVKYCEIAQVCMMQKFSRFEHHSNFSKLAFQRLTILQMIVCQTVNQGQIQRIRFSQLNLICCKYLLCSNNTAM